jgi:two-component sensor histidine kinase
VTPQRRRTPLPPAADASPVRRGWRVLADAFSVQIALGFMLAAVPLVLFAGWLVWSEISAQRDAVRALMHERVHNLMGDVESDLQQQVQVVQTLAALPMLDDWNLVLFHEAATRVQNLRPHWTAILLIDPTGERQLANTLRPLGAPLPPARSPDEIRAAARERAARIWTLRQLPADALHTAPIIAVAVPVIRDGEVRAVVAAALDLAYLQDIFRRHQLPPSWVATIYDGAGAILARTGESQNYLGATPPDDFRRMMLDQTSGLMRRQRPGGAEVYSAFQRFAIGGWTLAVHTPAAEIDRAAGRSATMALAGAVAAFLAALVLGIVLARELARRRAHGEMARTLARTKNLLSEKEMLLREIHHRVKNNLQMMASMVRLIGYSAPAMVQPILKDIGRRIVAMGHAYTLIYQADDLSRLDLADYIHAICGQTAEAFGTGRVRIRTRLDRCTADIDTAVPIGLIATELITNAFKHAYPGERGGEILVRLACRNDVGILTVRDDGVGLPESQRAGASGLGLMAALAGQVDGRLRAKTRPGGGAQVRLTFRLARKAARHVRAAA